jgi:hypothetical protein
VDSAGYALFVGRADPVGLFLSLVFGNTPWSTDGGLFEAVLVGKCVQRLCHDEWFV